MCSDVLTDSVHLRRIWGNACHPRGTCKIQWAESTNLKKKKEKKETALIIWLVSDLLCHKALLPQLSVSHNDRADTSCSKSYMFFIFTEITPIDDYRSYKSTVQIMSWWLRRGRIDGKLTFLTRGEECIPMDVRFPYSLTLHKTSKFDQTFPSVSHYLKTLNLIT